MPRSPSMLHFVRGLLQGQPAHRDKDHYRTADGRRARVEDVRRLISAGAITGDAETCRASAETSSWVKRTMIDCDAFQAQHRDIVTDAEGHAINLRESPLGRLALGESAFLERHQVEAGERVRRLVERAQLRQRVTMNYAEAVRGSGAKPGDLPDLAADARKALDDLHAVLPAECAGVVLDVCGLLKGLQEVERDRGWPRRSAKLVLRIGLEHLARFYGIGPHARGPERGRTRQWLDGPRPEMFA